MLCAPGEPIDIPFFFAVELIKSNVLTSVIFETIIVPPLKILYLLWLK